MLGEGNIDIERELDELYTGIQHDQRKCIGYPGARDLTVPVLARWSKLLLNNIGDPYDEGRSRQHTKRLERQVVATVAGLLRAPATRWGYVTNGATEGTEHALYDARRRYPDVVAYASTAAHYSVRKAADKLGVPLVEIVADECGAMVVDDLESQLKLRRDRAAVVVATVGTTMTEAVDDVAGIVAVCDRQAITRRRVHVDAALSGIPLALLPEAERPAFDFACGATSIVVSGHKFLSTLMPCGVLVYADRPWPTGTGRVSYIGSTDSTIAGSRSGHLPLVLWYVLHAFDHPSRARAARELAAYACRGLREIGVPARRGPHAFTVWFPPLPGRVMQAYGLASDGRHAHLITMPGVEKEVIDEFLADVRAAGTQGREGIDGSEVSAGRTRWYRPGEPRVPAGV